MPTYPAQGSPIDPADHPATNLPSPTQDYWADKPPSERPAKPHKSNIPEYDPHLHDADPWNAPFQPGNT